MSGCFTALLPFQDSAQLPNPLPVRELGLPRAATKCYVCLNPSDPRCCLCSLQRPSGSSLPGPRCAPQLAPSLGALTEPRFSCLPPNRAKKKVIAPTKVKVKVSSVFWFSWLVCAKSQVPAILSPVSQLCVCTSAAVKWLCSVFGLEKTTGTAKIDGSGIPFRWEGSEGSQAQNMFILPFIPRL